MSAINKDAPATDDTILEDDGMDAFAELDARDAELSDDVSDKDEDKVTDDEAAADDDDASDQDGLEDDDEGKDGDDEGESDDDSSSLKISDDTKITHKVDGEDREFTIGQLKRLAGQEASLTRKSQEVATKSKSVDTFAEAHVKTLEGLLAHARKQYEPFASINFLAAVKDPNISAEELQAAQDAHDAALRNVQYIEGELKGSVQKLQTFRQEALKEAAAECIKVLSDPEKGLKGWGPELYKEISTYAMSEGISQEVMSELVDPAAYKLIHKAMLYDKGQKVVKKVVGEKKEQKKAPKKIVKNSSAPRDTKADASKEAAAKKLAASGSVEDAAAFF